MTTVIDREQVLWGGVPSSACDELVAAVDRYLAALPEVCAQASDADLVAEGHAVERVRRRLAAADHPVVSAFARRGVGARSGYGALSRFLQAAWRISPRDAAGRVVAAELAGPRVALTGEPLPPLLPLVADAAGVGGISPEHVTVIGRVLDEVPPGTPVEVFAEAERVLTDAAVSLPPKEVGKVGQRLLAHLQPDGRAPSEAEARRHRRLSLTDRSDGSVEGSFRLAPVAGAKLRAVLDPGSAPAPAADGTPDPRTYPQRLADALEDLCDLGLRTGQTTPGGGTAAGQTSPGSAAAGQTSPGSAATGQTSPGGAGRASPGGPAVQLIITMTAEQYATRTGLAQTSHGQLLPVGDALRLAAAGADICRVVTNPRGVVLNFARTRRIATRSQTLALHARDGGCSFPGCTKPTDWCQRHHVVPWTDGGPTDLDNLTLLCSLHHREFEHWGWTCVMQDGLPTWIPPATIDPDRRPLRNDRGQVILMDP